VVGVVYCDYLGAECFECGVGGGAGEDDDSVFFGGEDALNDVAADSSCSACDCYFDHGEDWSDAVSSDVETEYAQGSIGGSWSVEGGEPNQVVI